MKPGHLARRLIALLVVLTASVACEHKPFCWHHPHDGMLRVEFAWWDAPEAEYTVRSMAFYAYPKDGGQVRRFDFAGSKGGTITLPAGDYHFLCLNSDTESYHFSGQDSHKTFTVETRDSYILAGMDVRADGGGDFSEEGDIKRAEGTYNEGVKESSEEGIYGHTLEDYNIHGQVGVTQVVTMYPRPVVIHYHVIIENIGCLETVLKVSGTLSGVSSKVRIHKMEVPGQGEDNNIIPFCSYRPTTMCSRDISTPFPTVRPIRRPGRSTSSPATSSTSRRSAASSSGTSQARSTSRTARPT